MVGRPLSCSICSRQLKPLAMMMRVFRRVGDFRQQAALGDRAGEGGRLEAEGAGHAAASVLQDLRWRGQRLDELQLGLLVEHRMVMAMKLNKKGRARIRGGRRETPVL